MATDRLSLFSDERLPRMSKKKVVLTEGQKSEMRKFWPAWKTNAVAWSKTRALQLQERRRPVGNAKKTMDELMVAAD
jgi:hypothetical protein